MNYNTPTTVYVWVPLLVVILAAILTGCGGGSVDFDDAVETALPERVDFNFHVKPILSDRCFKCHGPDNNTREAGLRFDTRDGIFAALQKEHADDVNRYAVVPGDVKASRLVHRVLAENSGDRMPPPESNLELTPLERATLVRWIEQGAEWKPHWSLIPPEEPEIPGVRDASLVRNPIDQFILARLEEAKLTLQPEADKETLIRRVSFDLTGLPPTLEAIDRFLADDSPNAYERVVDGLLASPRYGERMAADWMDVARFADSHGYQDDGIRDMSPWRDWVIRAFNENLPYDDFVTWQLAGDLLPEATHEQVLATGFNRNHMQSEEDGIVFEEYQVEHVVDRTNTFGAAFLGVTLECARCHDHKYDPVSQVDYYRLYGFFNNINEIGRIPENGMACPSLLTPEETTAAEIAQLKERIRDIEHSLKQRRNNELTAYAGWQAQHTGDSCFNAPIPSVYFPLDGADDAQRYNAMRLTASDRSKAFVPGHTGLALRLDGATYVTGDTVTAQFERCDPFSLSLWYFQEADSVQGALAARTAGVSNGWRGFELRLERDRLVAALNHVWPGHALEIYTQESIVPRRWHHVVMTYDGSSRAAGLRLFVDGAPAPIRVITDDLFKSIRYDRFGVNYKMGAVPLRIGMRAGSIRVDEDNILQDVLVDEVQVFDRALTAVEAGWLALGTVPEAGDAHWQEYFFATGDSVSRSLREQLTALRRELNAVETAAPEAMVMRERTVPRPTFVLFRGVYDAPTTQVTPGTPDIILPYPANLPSTRLGLARWLFDERHPLTARVAVNRIWQQCFGAGIVATPENFGSQGALPTHPELLDWLAVHFRESEWDIKALLKMIVMSAAYRQSSFADPNLLSVDSDNRLLARGPSSRLSAEMIRDNALAAAGLLSGTIGGPSVKPYQPEGLWEALAERGAVQYIQDHGDNLYRRTLYTYWKRSSPHPYLLSFDAADRDHCAVKRQRTNTPLQALALLNDPQFVEPCRVLAERMIREPEGDLENRIAYGFRLLAGRHPSEREVDLLEDLYTREMAHYTNMPADAQALLSVGEFPRDTVSPEPELAALTMVAHTIMNLDATYVKR